MAGFSIDTFTSKLGGGGALASLFEAELTKSQGPEQQASTGDFKFLCKSTTLPGDTIETATVTYMGRGINIPANRAAATWETTIYNDEGMQIRNNIESWMDMINSHKSNSRQTGMKAISSYTGTLSVSQLTKEDVGPVKTYTFKDVWPSSCAEIPLSWDTNEIQTFAVTWEYNYWTSTEIGIS